MPLSRRQKLALWIWWRRHKSKRIRMISVHPINQMRSTLGEYHHLMIQLREDEERFINYFRMGPRSFDKLLEYCRNDLTKKTTHCCVPIPPEERLVVTLRFLATGDSFPSLGFRFRMGFTTVRKIVLETVQVIWARLQATEMPVPTEDTWRVIAKDFFHRWNFPLCLGAIDGKHIRIKAPPNCGSKYFNYKGYHSIVLMAISDAMGRFIVIDVGGYGSSSDSGIIQDSSFFLLLQSNCLNLPQPELIPGSTTTAPHVFVTDEAFPLMTNILRPFPRRTLTEEKRVFNYRLSRARRQVECAFGILSTMWRVLNTCLEVHDTFACDIVKAACVLHNFVMNNEEERVRILVDETTSQIMIDQQNTGMPPFIGRPANDAMAVRDLFMTYFISPTGSLPWQFNR